MASFADAPAGDVAAGEKIFKTKCAQCHVAEKGGGHKQVGNITNCAEPNLLRQVVQKTACTYVLPTTMLAGSRCVYTELQTALAMSAAALPHIS